MKLPRFTLRDLFWLVLVCALGLGWLVERKQFASSQSKLIDALNKAGIAVVEGADGDLKFIPTSLSFSRIPMRPKPRPVQAIQVVGSSVSILMIAAAAVTTTKLCQQRWECSRKVD